MGGNAEKNRGSNQGTLTHSLQGINAPVVRVHRPGECSRASRMHLRMQLSPVSSSSTSFPSRTLLLALSRFSYAPSFSPLSLSFFLRSHILPPASPVSFHHILCSDFSPSSATCTPRVSPYSLLTFPAALIGTPLYFAHLPPSQRPSSSRPFSHFYIRSGKALPYPMNNPRRDIAIYICIYVCKRRKTKEKRRENSFHAQLRAANRGRSACRSTPPSASVLSSSVSSLYT